MTYTCTSCGMEYPRTPQYFFRSKNGKDGLESRCKQCRNGYRLEHKWKWKPKTKTAVQELKLHEAMSKFLYG